MHTDPRALTEFRRVWVGAECLILSSFPSLLLSQLQREHASILVSAAETAAASVAAAKKTPGGKRTASAARLADASIVTPDRDGGGEGGEVKSEGCAYVEAGSYVFLEIELHKPLIPKRPPSVLAQR